MIPSLPFSVAWIGVAIAVAQIAVLVLHLRRRYPSVPKRVPLGLRWDGRPRAMGAKRWLWVPPAVLAAVVAILAAVMVAEPLPEEKRLMMLFVFLVIAEVAWSCEWSTDRQIELARGMTHRIAPTRMLLIVLPILATVGVAVAVAITQSL
jgi:hypothetical protein